MSALGHSPESELGTRLADAARLVRVGSLYEHYKGQMYRVTGLAITEATEEVAVLYQSQVGENVTYTRPLVEWVELVQHEGQSVPRFKRPATQI